MQCPQCHIEVGSGVPVFERVSAAGKEWVCSEDCCKASTPQGELWSVWKPAVCVEERVELHGAIVHSARFTGGKTVIKTLTIILPADASLDQLDSLVLLEVDLTLVRSRVQALPIDDLESVVLLKDLGLDPQEIEDLERVDLFTANQVAELKADALADLTGWTTTVHAKKVIKICKAAIKKQ